MIDYRRGVQLEPLDSSHLEKAREWRNRPEIYKWCRQKTLISDAEHLRWFESQSKDPSIQMFAITNSGKHIGVCGFTSIDMLCRRAEFSLYVAPEFHGSGYGGVALQTLLDHGFKDFGFNSIWGETFEDNAAAKMFERVGMKKEGTRRQFYFKNGKFIDAHIYSVLAEEWNS